MPTAIAAVGLPEPITRGNVSIEEVLERRRSVRQYASAALSLEDVSQLLWAAQGVTSAWGGRTAPSAGGLYPLAVLAVAGNVDGLPPGVYRYVPRGHVLNRIRPGDVREQLADAALGQESIRAGSISIVVTAVYARTTAKYGTRGVRYVDMEAGHVAQNVCLLATARGLGTVTVGAFTDDAVRDVLQLGDEEAPLYVLPVGQLGEE